MEPTTPQDGSLNKPETSQSPPTSATTPETTSTPISTSTEAATVLSGQRDEALASTSQQRLQLAKEAAEQNDTQTAGSAVIDAWDSFRQAYGGRVPAEKMGEFNGIADAICASLPEDSAALVRAELQIEQGRDENEMDKVKSQLILAKQTLASQEWQKSAVALSEAWNGLSRAYGPGMTKRAVDRFGKAVIDISIQGKTGREEIFRQIFELYQTTSLSSAEVKRAAVQMTGAMMRGTFTQLILDQGRSNSGNDQLAALGAQGSGMASGMAERFGENVLKNQRDPSWLPKFRSIVDELNNIK